MSGPRAEREFKLEDQVSTIAPLSFLEPGLGIDLAGSYDMAKYEPDFHGIQRMRARVSQTTTGWKR